MTDSAPEFQRFVGRMRGAGKGPTLLVVAAIHGNEPAGVHAARRVLTRLREERYPLYGEFVCVVGNVAAAKKGVRYQVKDLNRAWSEDRVEKLRRAALLMPWDAEDAEQVELFQAIEQVRRTARGPITLLDLHTTSGDGAPFATIADTPQSRAFASRFPLTCLTGLVECLKGTMLVALSQMGVAAMVVECGQNAEPQSVDHAEAALWIGLVSAGLLDGSDLPHLAQAERLLTGARGPLPSAMEVVYRHPIKPEDNFEMMPGFRHFMPVDKGQVLAKDVRGEVVAPESGYILMPLYQGLGDDGFFIGRAVGS